MVVNGTELEFKLDTGADVTCITEGGYQKLTQLQLNQSGKKLRGAGQHWLTVCGSFSANLKCGDREVEQEVYVIKDLESPLLGRPAIEKLRFLSMVDSVTEEYPKVFSGLGKLEGEYRIELKEDSQPYAVTVPRRVPLPANGKGQRRVKQVGGSRSHLQSGAAYRLVRTHGGGAQG